MVVFLGILILVVVVLPLIIQLLQNESKQAVQRQRSTVAFQLAEAAVAKGVSKITETRKNYMDAIAGIPLSDYNDDREYTDVPGGKYKVKITSGSAPGTLCIVGKGMDDSSREVRVIAAEYSGNDPDAPAIIFNQGQFGGGGDEIIGEWGSVKSYNNLEYLKEYVFPRLYSAGSIEDRDGDPTSPNTDNVHYWAYQTDMGSPPVADLAYYKQKAMDSIVPSSSTTGEIRLVDGSPVVRNPPNSGYFLSSLNPGKNVYFDKQSALPEGWGNFYDYRSSTSVIYLDYVGGSSYYHIREVFFDIEALVVPNVGLTIHGSSTPYHVFGATIPETAPFQYQSSVPIHVGFPSGQTVWSTTYQAIFSQPTHCCYGITNLQLHGYFYGRMPSVSRVKILGVAHFLTQGNFSNKCKVYFDPAVLENVAWAKVPIYQISWKETSHSW